SMAHGRKNFDLFYLSVIFLPRQNVGGTRNGRQENSMHFILTSLLILFQANTPLFENDYVQVFKNAAPCASAGATCGETIIVALGPTEVAGQMMGRGDLKSCKNGETYAASTGAHY